MKWECGTGVGGDMKCGTGVGVDMKCGTGVGGDGECGTGVGGMGLSIEWRSSNTISDIHSIHLIHCPSIQAQQGQLTTCKVTTSNEYKEDLINHADCIYTYIHHLSTSLGGGGIFALLEESKIANF